ncbi:MAG: DUF4350 domain-containing protein [Actinobacteria bacterium]|nr:DUF4350 domain-containing protein [Actinomycetota bacterium]
MTATAAAPSAATSGGRGKRVWPWVALVAGLLVVAVVAGAPNQRGRQYDPTSNDVLGTKALVELVRSYGTDVDITDVQPPADADIAIAFPGAVPVDREAALRSWVSRGNTLVVADPRSGLTPYGRESNRFTGVLVSPTLGQGDCDIAALRDAKTLKLGDEAETVLGARRFPVPPGGQRCFTNVPGEDAPSDEGQAAIVAVAEGRGTIVSVGTPDIFVNSLLAANDNAVVAVDLLAPQPGKRVAFLQRPPGATPDPSLSTLLSTGVKLALLQLLLAFVVYLFVRGRRLGKPVLEPQLVQIPGSELVSAVGNLLQQTKSPDRAATILRADVRRRLCERLGLPSGAAPDVIAGSVEARAGIERASSLSLLADGPCPSEAALLDLAAGLDDLRRQVLGGA